MGIEGASAEVFAAADAALREQQKHEKKRGMQGREEEPLDEEEHEETLDEQDRREENGADEAGIALMPMGIRPASGAERSPAVPPGQLRDWL